MFTRKIITVTAAATLLLAAGAAVAAIQGSKHDMTSATQSANFNSPDNVGGQICIFCHTPHNATASSNGPIWNRANSALVYTMYAQTQAENTPESTPGAESMACLSCHDGSVAVDSISNFPGSNTSWATNGTQITGYALVGNDLRDDHPVSIAYDVNAAGLKSVATAELNGMVLYGTSNMVECASCHSVHDNSNGSFLRASADQSVICVACHDR